MCVCVCAGVCVCVCVCVCDPFVMVVWYSSMMLAIKMQGGRGNSF